MVMPSLISRTKCVGIPRNRMGEFCTYGSVGGAPGNRCFYPDVDIRIILLCGRKPTLFSTRKAADVDTIWRVFRSPPESETRACAQRGNSGTWEIQMFPCVRERY